MLKALLTSFLSIVFIAILSAQANSYNDLVRQAERLHANERNYKGALGKYRQAFALQQPFAKDLYNAACSATLSGNTDQGFEMLKQAIDAGWSDETTMKMDRDMKALRDQTMRWNETIALIKKKAEELKNAQASLKAATIPPDKAHELLAPFFADGRWGVMRRDQQKEVLPAIFDLPPFFGSVGIARFRNQWYKLDVATGSALPYAPPTPSMYSPIFASPVVPSAQSPAKGFVVDARGRLKDRSAQYEVFDLVEYHPSMDTIVQYWAVVKFKNTQKWGVVNAAGEPLPGTRSDYNSLEANKSLAPLFEEKSPKEQVMLYEKATGERGLLDFSGKTHLVKGFDNAAFVPLDMSAKPGDRTFIKFKKGGKWGVIGRKPGSTQWVVILEPRFSDVSGYGYGFTGKFEEEDPTSYQIHEYIFRVQEGADTYCVDLKGKVYRLKK